MLQQEADAAEAHVDDVVEDGCPDGGAEMHLACPSAAAEVREHVGRLQAFTGALQLIRGFI